MENMHESMQHMAQLRCVGLHRSCTSPLLGVVPSTFIQVKMDVSQCCSLLQRFLFPKLSCGIEVGEMKTSNLEQKRHLLCMNSIGTPFKLNLWFSQIDSRRFIPWSLILQDSGFGPVIKTRDILSWIVWARPIPMFA